MKITKKLIKELAEAYARLVLGNQYDTNKIAATAIKSDWKAGFETAKIMLTTK